MTEGWYQYYNCTVYSKYLYLYWVYDSHIFFLLLIQFFRKWVSKNEFTWKFKLWVIKQISIFWIGKIIMNGHVTKFMFLMKFLGVKPNFVLGFSGENIKIFSAYPHIAGSQEEYSFQRASSLSRRIIQATHSNLHKAVFPGFMPS